jgi:glycosidase
MSNKVRSVSDIDFLPQNDVFPSPQDWRDQFIYFLLVDRFDNNQSNIHLHDPVSASGSRDPAQGKLFQGGNLRGITRRLDYIRNLGCTAIWLSPIFKNRQEKNDTYHGLGMGSRTS